MIEIISKNGKRIGKISDSLDQEDMIIVDGKEITLDDAYNSDTVIAKFNKELKIDDKK